MAARRGALIAAAIGCAVLVALLGHCGSQTLLRAVAVLLPSFAILFIAAKFEAVAAFGGAIGLWVMARRFGLACLPEGSGATFLLYGMAYALVGALVFLLGARLIRRISRP